MENDIIDEYYILNCFLRFCRAVVVVCRSKSPSLRIVVVSFVVFEYILRVAKLLALGTLRQLTQVQLVQSDALRDYSFPRVRVHRVPVKLRID